MKQVHAYKLDLTKIAGDGDFSCPRCGNTISPDDETEVTYSILEARVNGHGLEEIVIRCNRCSSSIHLTGFSFLQRMSEITKEKNEARQKGETPFYITHI